MQTSLLKPKVDLASLVMRWGIAAIFLVHGYFKVVQDFPLLPELNMNEQAALGWAEIAVGASMALGLLARIAALAAIAHQTAAVVMITGRLALAGFAVGPNGADFTRVGPEFNLVIVALCLGVVFLGSGALSVDALLLRLLSRGGSETPAPTPALARTH